MKPKHATEIERNTVMKMETTKNKKQKNIIIKCDDF